MTNKTVTVCIGNYGYYSEGGLHDAWLSLPASNADIAAFLKAHRLYDSMHEEIYVSDYDGVPFGLWTIFNERTNLEDLNLLARQMREKPYECEVVNQYLECGADAPADVLELMNMIEQADQLGFFYYHNDGASSEERYALDCIEDMPEFKELEANGLIDYIDLERLGRDYGMDCYLGEEGYVADYARDFDDDLYSREELEELYGPVDSPARMADAA